MRERWRTQALTGANARASIAHTAAQLVLSWSHRGRIGSEATCARSLYRLLEREAPLTTRRSITGNGVLERRVGGRVGQ